MKNENWRSDKNDREERGEKWLLDIIGHLNQTRDEDFAKIWRRHGEKLWMHFRANNFEEGERK